MGGFEPSMHDSPPCRVWYVGRKRSERRMGDRLCDLKMNGSKPYDSPPCVVLMEAPQRRCFTPFDDAL